MARQLGKVEGETLIVIRPEYKRYPPKVAPLMRNQLIVDIINLLYACYDGRKEGGTHDTIKRAKREQGKGKVRIQYLTPIQIKKEK